MVSWMSVLLMLGSHGVLDVGLTSVGFSAVYMDILSSLHKQVLSSSSQDVLQQFEFFLLVLKTSAKESEINPLVRPLLPLPVCCYSAQKYIC